MAKLLEKKWRDRYYEGEISVDEFLDRVLNGKDGDRNRRKLEQKYRLLMSKTFFAKNKHTY